MVSSRGSDLSLLKWLFSVLEIPFSSYLMLTTIIYVFSPTFLTIIFGKGPEREVEYKTH